MSQGEFEIVGPTSMTFHGPDGSGKSTIAMKLSESLREDDGVPVVSIGGSTFREWLTPAIARRHVGSSKRIESAPSSMKEKTLLYEDIAIACYGYASDLVDQGKYVVIDSDPYLKRFMWALAENDPEAYLEYRDYFERRMQDSIGNQAPSNIIGVNIFDQSADVSQNYFARIQHRKSESDYDPHSPDEVAGNITSANNVWSDIVECRRYDRIREAAIFSVVNKECSAELVSVNAMTAVVKIKNELLRLN